MCGKAYDPRFMFAWPTARYAVMSGESAAGTLVELKIKQLEREGKKLTEKDKKELYESIRVDLRTPDRPALRRRAALGGRDHRSGAHARGADRGARIRGAESARRRVQDRSSADIDGDRSAAAQAGWPRNAGVYAAVRRAVRARILHLIRARSPNILLCFRALVRLRGIFLYGSRRRRIGVCDDGRRRRCGENFRWRLYG